MTHVKFKNDEDTVISPQTIEVHNSVDGEWDEKDLIRYASRNDSMFHYFDLSDKDEAEEEVPLDEASVIGRIDSEISKLLKAILSTNDNTLDVQMGTPPSWHINRDETFTVNAFIDNVDDMFKTLDRHFGHNTIFLRADILAAQGRPGSEAEKVEFWYDVFPLIQEVNEQNTIIMDALYRDITHRDSMRVLTDPLTKIYSGGLEEKFDLGTGSEDNPEDDVDPRKYYGWSNWFLKAKYLSDSLHSVYPQNFRNIVIYGAAKLIAQDHLKVTKLQQYLAAMGRTGTRLILVD